MLDYPCHPEIGKPEHNGIAGSCYGPVSIASEKTSVGESGCLTSERNRSAAVLGCFS